MENPYSSAPSESGDHHVPAGLHRPVGLDYHAVTQAVAEQGLLGLGQAELPRATGVLGRAHRRRARTAIVAGNEDDISVGFGHARRHGPHPVSETSFTLMRARGLAFFRSYMS